ncbi:MAG: MotA/TolQ/ExbB proton channel family protein [Phycisphaerae bacterium]|nr:MotA/TolQ/ExbB proton channel family protein [Phycisphaerae bacterium]
MKNLKLLLAMVFVTVFCTSVALAGGGAEAPAAPEGAPAETAAPAEGEAPAEAAEGEVLAEGEGPAEGAEGEPVVKATLPPEEKEERFLNVLLKGGYTMIPIALASIIALAAILSSFYGLSRGRVIPQKFVEGVRERINANDVNGAMDLCRNRPSPIANILLAGLRKHGSGTSEIEKGIEDAGSREVNSMRQSIRVLSAVGVIAPLLGLFGTVLGIYRSFGAVATAAGVRPEVLAVGINEALITTISGLMVAIPSYTFFYFFRSRVDSLVYDIEELSIDAVEHLTAGR